MVLRPDTSEKYAQIAEAFAATGSTQAVARRFDVSTRTVRAALKEHDMSGKRMTGAGRTLTILAVLVLATPVGKGRSKRLTHTFARLGETLGGVSRQRIHQVFNEAKTLGLLPASLKHKEPDLTKPK